MGIIKGCFSFIAGTVTGVYVAQNYKVPNIAKLADTFLFVAKVTEQTYRKPDKKDENDDWFITSCISITIRLLFKLTTIGSDWKHRPVEFVSS